MRVWIKPAEGTPHIPMPPRGKPLDAAGELVEKDIFVRRLIEDGDVVEFDPAKQPAAAAPAVSAASAAPAASKSSSQENAS